MRRRLIVTLVMGLVAALAAPAGANEPNVEEFPAEVLWTVANPCAVEFEEVNLVVASTLSEHLHRSGRITVVRMAVEGEGAWYGSGIDTGVQLAEGENVQHRLVVSNSETGDKFRLTIQGHFNALTGEWNFEPAQEVECVRT
jgi:hypothetical protein